MIWLKYHFNLCVEMSPIQPPSISCPYVTAVDSPQEECTKEHKNVCTELESAHNIANAGVREYLNGGAIQ